MQENLVEGAQECQEHSPETLATRSDQQGGGITSAEGATSRMVRAVLLKARWSNFFG